MTTSLDRAERRVKEQSVALKKPLGLGDLVLTQIVFVVGSGWVGTAAKLGTSHLFFWLLAILLFYIPQAAVVIYLSGLMPLEGGIYQWAKLAFNEFTGFIVAWNLWLLSIMVIALGGMFITTNISYAMGDAASWMRDSPWCVSLISCMLVSGLGWTGVRGLSLGKWVHNIGGFAMFLAYGALIVLPFISLARGDLGTYRPLEIAAPAMPLFYCFNIFSKLAVGGLSGFEYVGILAGEARAPARNIGRSRLPMVAGWDHLLPVWFSRLHPRYKTPINSIMFVGAITLVIAISSQIGAGLQEAFQLVDNAANVFYGIVYTVMFAIPVVGAAAIRAGARSWLRLAADCGFAVCLLAIFFTIYPIIDVPSPLTFAAKIIAVTVIANAIGAAIFSLGQRRRAAQENSTA